MKHVIMASTTYLAIVIIVLMAGINNASAEPEVVILMDTSGSMTWSHEGTPGVPEEQQRITLAKRAVEPFLIMMAEHYSNEAEFGIAAFPDTDYQCVGREVRRMDTVNEAAVNDVIYTIFPGLWVGGNTPLLAGLDKASLMFQSDHTKSIVLLSDGYHNCPYPVDPDDPEVTLITDFLARQSIPVHSIGFGRPGDIDNVLLQTISSDTSGEFYDVTGEGYSEPWDAGVALQDTYKNIAVDSLGLESLVDPLCLITAYQEVTHPIKISRFENKVTFYYSWSSLRKGGLSFTLISSDGKTVPTYGDGISFKKGDNYYLLTLDEKFLGQFGKVSTIPWRLIVKSGYIPKGMSQVYQYSVVGQSDLKLKPVVFAKEYNVYQPVTLMAQFTAYEKPVTGLNEVVVKINPPYDPGGKGDYLLLYDDGTHGDREKNDGIYTNQYEKIEKEGTYSFSFLASGMIYDKYAFERNSLVKQYFRPKR